MNLEDKISAAKTQLMLGFPFIGTLLFNSNLSEREDIKTLATDGKSIWYNAEFIEPMSVKELVFCLAHEVMHIALLHCVTMRNGNKDKERWNIAGDYVINQLLTEDGIGKMPEGGLLDADIYNRGGQTTEGVYAILPEEQSNDFDNLLEPDGNPEELEQEAKIRIAQAANAARMSGRMSDGIKRLVDEILAPKIDWRNVLLNFVTKCKDESRSWARPNRRFLSQRMYVPSIDGECMDDIVVAVDCSGSIGDSEIGQFAAEIKSIAENVRPKTVHVIYFDSSVCHYDAFPAGEEVSIAPHGGGGTAFSPVFKYVEENEIEPCCCTFLTDLCCNDFGDAPEYPVLWVTTCDTDAPFGEVVKMKLD